MQFVPNASYSLRESKTSNSNPVKLPKQLHCDTCFEKS